MVTITNRNGITMPLLLLLLLLQEVVIKQIFIYLLVFSIFILRNILLNKFWFYEVTGGKEFEGEKETYTNNAEWKERVEKWKTRQEKRGMVTNDDEGNDQGEEEEDEYL